jgi:hypothetical protein
MSIRRNSITSKLAAIAIAIVMVCFVCRNSHSDDWRRTASGWERMGNWTMNASAAVFPLLADHHPATAKASRFDTHPAVLAFGELVAVLLALYAFRSSPILPAASQWPALLARSFRASAFGS